jgi:hypothetical protein
MNNQQLLAWLLRVSGAVEILAFIAVIMPTSWMIAAHAWLGMGEMQASTLVMFMIRQSSYVYGAHGISLLILATDVKRFRPLILFNALSFLLAAPVFFVIDYFTGMPWFWTIFDPVGCALFGVGVLILDRKIR